MLRRVLCVFLVCLAGLGTADISALYRKTANTLNHLDRHELIAIAPDQSAYLVGRYYPNAAGTGLAKVQIRKVTKTGTVQWTKYLEALAPSQPIRMYSIACDPDGNLYMAGNELNGQNLVIAALYKFDQNGTQIWRTTYGSNYLTPNTFTKIIIANGVITVLRNGTDITNFDEVHLMQFSYEGVFLKGTDFPPGSAFGANLAFYNGFWYVGGHFRSAEGYAGTVMRFGADLQYVDRISYHPAPAANIRVTDFRISPNGELVFFGYRDDDEAEGALVLAYNTDYDLLFDSFYSGAGRKFVEGAVGMVEGQMCAVGVGAGSSAKALVRVLNLPSGGVRWTLNFDQAGVDTGAHVLIDRYGSVWWNGTTNVDGQSGAIVQRLLGGSGLAASSYFDNGSGNGDESAGAMAIDDRDELRMGGMVTLTGTGPDSAYWHFIQTPQCSNDTLQTPNNTAWELDTFANDRYVNDRCTFTFTVSPAHGTVAMNAAKNRIVYTPTTGYTGPDTFTYKVQRGTYTDTAVVNLTVKRMLTSITADRNPIAGQNQTFGRVTMSTPAAAGGDVVAIQETSSLITTPTSVTVPAGASTVSFTIAVLPVISQQIKSILATHGGITRELLLVMDPLVPTAISFTPNPVVGGNTTVCKVVINGVAGTGGRTIAIVENSSYCTAPTTVTVPAGAGSVSFNITTVHPTTQQVVTITARVTAGEKSAILRINP